MQYLTVLICDVIGYSVMYAVKTYILSHVLLANVQCCPLNSPENVESCFVLMKHHLLKEFLLLFPLSCTVSVLLQRDKHILLTYLASLRSQCGKTVRRWHWACMMRDICVYHAFFCCVTLANTVLCVCTVTISLSDEQVWPPKYPFVRNRSGFSACQSLTHFELLIWWRLLNAASERFAVISPIKGYMIQSVELWLFWSCVTSLLLTQFSDFAQATKGTKL